MSHRAVDEKAVLREDTAEEIGAVLERKLALAAKRERDKVSDEY